MVDYGLRGKRKDWEDVRQHIGFTWSDMSNRELLFWLCVLYSYTKQMVDCILSLIQRNTCVRINLNVILRKMTSACVHITLTLYNMFVSTETFTTKTHVFVCVLYHKTTQYMGVYKP